jgi:dipeptidyl aminopeptidase/acylaminoacyl peptidase
VVRTEGKEQGSTQDSHKPKTPPARLITTLKYRYNGEGFTYDRRHHLFVIDAASGETRQLTQGDWDDTQPAWSPDGRSIVYLGYADAEDAPRNSRLWLVPAAGGPPRCLTAHLDRDLAITETAAPIWQADGAAIIVGMQDRGSVGVIQVQVADGAMLPLVHGRRSVTSYSVADVTVAFTVAEPHRPAEVYVRMALGERQVTALNADWCATVELPEPEHFIVHSDGGEIDA